MCSEAELIRRNVRSQREASYRQTIGIIDPPDMIELPRLQTACSLNTKLDTEFATRAGMLGTKVFSGKLMSARIVAVIGFDAIGLPGSICTS